MSTIDTTEFRDRLEQERERLQRTIENHELGNASLVEETGELLSGSQDNHMADTATETYERELDEGLEEDARDRLRQVERALERIESGEYGRCEVCGKEIAPDRLEAVPWATLCIDDARRLGR